jgi:hypothetical protein
VSGPGRMFHYVLADGPRAGECRPATLVRWQDRNAEVAVLHVLTDGLEDGPRFHDPHSRMVARRGEAGQPGRFHPCDGNGECAR